MIKIILASKSPRRREILEMLAWEFQVDSRETEEVFLSEISIEENMKRIAYEKAKAVAHNYTDEIILACDTMVVVGEEIFGKPKDEKEAKEMLEKLSAKHSEVYSAVALLYPKRKEEKVFLEKTNIYFHQLTEKEILDYIQTGEAMDKAGAYAIQGRAAMFIKKIEGDYWNVVGLPISRIYQELQEWKWAE